MAPPAAHASAGIQSQPSPSSQDQETDVVSSLKEPSILECIASHYEQQQKKKSDIQSEQDIVDSKRVKDNKEDTEETKKVMKIAPSIHVKEDIETKAKKRLKAPSAVEFAFQKQREDVGLQNPKELSAATGASAKVGQDQHHFILMDESNPPAASTVLNQRAHNQQSHPVSNTRATATNLPGAYACGTGGLNEASTTRRQRYSLGLLRGISQASGSVSSFSSSAGRTLPPPMPTSSTPPPLPPPLPVNVSDTSTANSGLAEAQLVGDEESDQVSQSRKDLEVADPVDLSALELRKRKAAKSQLRHRNTARILGSIAMVVVVGGIILTIVVAVNISNQNSGHSNEVPLGDQSTIGYDGQTATPSLAPTTMADIIPGLPDFTLHALQNPNSPQFRAMEWLSEHPKLPTMPVWRKRQLLALVTLFYRLHGEEWIPVVRDDWLDYERSECYWYSSSFTELSYNLETHQHYLIGLNNNATVCDEDGHFHTVNITVPLFGGFEDEGLQWPQELTLISESLQHLEFVTFGSGQSLDVMLPPFFEQMTNFRTINYGWNNFTGSIPERVFDYNLPLQLLDLQRNLINSTIPSQLGTMSNTLHLLNLRGSFMFGSVPSELYELTELTHLEVLDNQLTGTISERITDLRALTHLDLGGNAFVGVMPPGLFNMTDLEVLSVGGNLLEGTIPSWIDKMTKLRILNLGGNVFDPGAWKMLKLGPNLFHGTIPSTMFNMTNLQVFSLSGNSFEGSILTSVGIMTDLLVVDLSDNAFVQGSIPSEIGQLSSLETLRLGGTNITGTMPAEVCNLPNLTVLEVNCTYVICDCNCTCL